MQSDTPLAVVRAIEVGLSSADCQGSDGILHGILHEGLHNSAGGRVAGSAGDRASDP